MSKVRKNKTIEGWRIPPNPEGTLWKKVEKFDIEEFMKNIKSHMQASEQI